MQFAAGRLRLERACQSSSQKLKQLVALVEPLATLSPDGPDGAVTDAQTLQDDVVMIVRKGRALYGEVVVGAPDRWKTANGEDLRKVEVLFSNAERFLMGKLLRDVVHPLLVAAFVCL